MASTPDQQRPDNPDGIGAAIPIIGLAGAIGAGKSALARAFARLGCLVIDSDREAREALDRPEVRERLVEWWGGQILTPEGRVDRRRIADRIFGDERERKRLEGLVHPLIRRTRDGARREAGAAGKIGVIYDAPLLFEAGIDAICDGVVFVDAPRAVRLQRVRETRGWDEAELDRREAMQWSPERKKAASGFIVRNDGPEEALDAHARDILRRLGVELP
ncbi:MAG: dephospho-CoA kinase [Phycisphaerales bacterium]